MTYEYSIKILNPEITYKYARQTGLAE